VCYPRRTEIINFQNNIFDELFPAHLALIPQLNEVYELELAFYESLILSDEELIKNGAYFAKVGDIPTRHFLMCQGEPLKLAKHSSSRLKSFFETNQFKTGYATNGLFPYRGKFHPQMIKGLINIMGCKSGNTVLDPMMGSGTVLIEATLMGINSLGVDISPFCEFMVRAKLSGMTVNTTYLRKALKNFDILYQYFTESPLAFKNTDFYCDDFPKEFELPEIFEDKRFHDYLALSFLDAKGYSERSKRKSLREQFKAILERYLFVAEKIQSVLSGHKNELGTARPMQGDARQLDIPDESIDGIIFSPPYSFAIDYLKNDASHLNILGADIETLKKNMIGLRHKKPKEKYEGYLIDMHNVINECHRVLKKDKICSIIVGTNNNQLSKILNIGPDEVKGLNVQLREMGEAIGLKPIKSIERKITGIANTMRSEFIEMIKKV
jgi:tRNA G10  N-methylase Trm11